MSKDTNMLFKPAMVRGLLTGSKTMTRRLFSDKLCITENPGQYKLHGVAQGHSLSWRTEGKKYHDERSYALFEDLLPAITPWIEPIEVPQGEVGDRVYVRETHYRYGKWQWMTHNSKGVPGWVFVAWDDRVMFEDNLPEVLGKERAATMNMWWRRPSLFMLKGHTRIIMEITEKKVERLWDISEEDAKREGVEYLFSQAELDRMNGGHKPPIGVSDPRLWLSEKDTGYKNYMWHGMPDLNPTHVACWRHQYSSYNNARDSFFSLWASINGVQSFNKNPWVVALGLKRVL